MPNQKNINIQLDVFDAIPEFKEKAVTTRNKGFQLSCLLVSMTPKMAKIVLKTTVNNRNISQSRVLEYRRRMERGEWVLSEPWLFDKYGYLIDGQHRATALAQLDGHNISIPVLLIQGWPEETQSAVDIGYNRTICSIAQIRGVDLRNDHLSIMNSMIQMSSCDNTIRSPEAAINAYTAMKERIDFAAQRRGGASTCFLAPVRAVVATAYPYENHEKLDRFLTVWDTMMAANEIEQPIARLRSQYEQRDRTDNQGRSFRSSFSRRTVCVLDAFLKGKVIKRLVEKECPWKTVKLVNGSVVIPD